MLLGANSTYNVGMATATNVTLGGVKADNVDPRTL